MWAESWSTQPDDEQNRSFNYRPEAPVGELLFTSLRVLRRRAVVAIVTFFLFAVPAGIFVKMRPPVFEPLPGFFWSATTKSRRLLKETIDPAASTYFQTQIQVLRSRPIVAKTIEKLKLWEFLNSPGLERLARPPARRRPSSTRSFSISRPCRHLARSCSASRSTPRNRRWR